MIEKHYLELSSAGISSKFSLPIITLFSVEFSLPYPHYISIKGNRPGKSEERRHLLLYCYQAAKIPVKISHVWLLIPSPLNPEAFVRLKAAILKKNTYRITTHFRGGLAPFIIRRGI